MCSIDKDMLNTHLISGVPVWVSYSVFKLSRILNTADHVVLCSAVSGPGSNEVFGQTLVLRDQRVHKVSPEFGAPTTTFG